MEIIFNEIVIDKSVFRMVLIFIDVKYFNLKKVPLFLSLVLTRLKFDYFLLEHFMRNRCFHIR